VWRAKSNDSARNFSCPPVLDAFNRQKPDNRHFRD